VWAASRGLRAHPLPQMSEGASSGIFLPHQKFLLQLSGQTLPFVCRKICGRDSRPRPSPPLDLFHPSSAARAVRARALVAGFAVANRLCFPIEDRSGEADPLLCSCGARMRIVSFISDPRVVDRILRHLGSGRCRAQDPFEPRAPPAAAATIRQ
jgi:hypothetical protein